MHDRDVVPIKVGIKSKLKSFSWSLFWRLININCITDGLSKWLIDQNKRIHIESLNGDQKICGSIEIINRCSVPRVDKRQLFFNKYQHAFPALLDFLSLLANMNGQFLTGSAINLVHLSLHCSSNDTSLEVFLRCWCNNDFSSKVALWRCRCHAFLTFFSAAAFIRGHFNGSHQLYCQEVGWREL